MEDRQHLERRLRHLEHTVRVYRACLGAILLLALVLGAVLGFAKPPQFGRAIIVDGKTVLLVRNEKAAAAVRQRLLHEAARSDGGAPDGDMTFREKWEDAPRPADGAAVLSVAEAVARLRPRLTVIREAVAIESSGTRLVVVPNRDVAQRVLDQLKSRYACPSDAVVRSTSLRPTPAVRPCMVLPSEITGDEREAAGKLGNTRVREDSCVVRPGDYPERIAERYRMSLTDFWRLNPSLRGQTLRAGQTVSVLGKPAGLTVVTVKETVSSVPLPPPVDRQPSPDLPRGQKKVADPGKVGVKRVRWEVTMNDEREVARRPLSEEIIDEPQPQRILIGTGQ